MSVESKHEGRREGGEVSRPFRIVEPTRDKETIEFLEEMLDRAKNGECLGIAIVAMLKDRKYVTNVTGEVSRNPTLGLGMLRVLDHELARRVLG